LGQQDVGDESAQGIEPACDVVTDLCHVTNPPVLPTQPFPSKRELLLLDQTRR
jgi:hypothetical protein